jgi:hypothetical protein
MYTTINNGDYLRVDYNLGGNTVRLYVEVVADKGASYYSIIENGRVSIEKNSSGKLTNVAVRLRERADEFSTLPNKEVLGLINNNYGILSNNISGKKTKKEQLQFEREEIKRRYFQSDENRSLGTVIYRRISLKKLEFIDFLDITAGIMVSALFFYLDRFSLLTAGAVAVMWGIILGVLDIFIRKRDPFFLKILLFLLSGAGIYIYSYLYL